MMRIAKSIAVFLLSITIGLICVELFLRNAAIIPTKYTQFNDKLGLVFKPNSKILILQEGFYIGQINGSGYLGDTKDVANQFKIAFIGDSYVEGFQLFPRYHYANILKQKLSKYFPVKVMNFGMAGFDLGDIYCRYKGFILRYKPDLTFIFVNQGDLKYSRNIFFPYLEIHNDKLTIDYSFTKTEAFVRSKNYEKSLKSFWYNSSLFNLVASCDTLVKMNMAWLILLDKFYVSQTADIASPVIGEKEIDPISRKIFEDMDTNSVVLVIHGEFSEGIKNYLVDSDFTVIDLNLCLKSLEKEGIDPYYWKSTNKSEHFNHYAHKAIADELAKQVVERYRLENEFRVQ